MRRLHLHDELHKRKFAMVVRMVTDCQERLRSTLSQ